MMNYQQTLDYLYSQFPEYQRIGARAVKVGLDNSRIIDEHLGHPHRSFRSVHVAGTNGKGSISHTLAAILQSAGYITGLYTSPHLVDFRERIRVDGCMIPKEEVTAFVERNEFFFKTLHPSFFEITMAMAFDYFRRVGVEVAVVEVGLGGRLDSTNIIMPDLSVITNIGLDHTLFLGETLPEIAAEKAGIIKTGKPVVIGEHSVETDSVFIEKATSENAEIMFAEDEYKILQVHETEDFLEFKIERENGEQIDVAYSLTGLYQHKNILTVLAAVDELRRKGYEISDEAIREGFENVQELTGLTGRWQKIASHPDMIVDTGHNAHGVRIVAQQLMKCMEKYANVHIVWGMASDKHPEKVIPLLPKEAKFYYTQADSPRSMPVEELAKIGEQCDRRGDYYLTVTEALAEAKRKAAIGDLIFIGGSNYVVAEVL